RDRLPVLLPGTAHPGRRDPLHRRQGAPPAAGRGRRRRRLSRPPGSREGPAMSASTATFGTNAVDWEERVQFDRLRVERLARLRGQLERSELGALLAFDFANIRYMSATHIGTWAMDKMIRFALLTRNSDPIVWDFGSAARHHQLYNPWLATTTAEMDADPHAPHHNAVRPRLESGARAGISTLRGAFNPDAGIAEEVARKIKRELERFEL